MSADVRLSPEVLAALGAEGARRVVAMFRAGARCAVCDRALPAGGPVSVLLARGGETHHVTYAHPGCSASMLVELPAAVMAAAVPDELDMAMTSLVMDAGPVLLPALVAELTTGIPLVADARGGVPGELTSLLTSTLLGQGFGLVLDVYELPPRVGGWRIAARPGRPGAAHLEITGRAGLLFYTGTADIGEKWAAAAEDRWCLLYAAAEPVDWPQDVADNAGSFAALCAAAATGGLVGARVPIVWSPP